MSWAGDWMCGACQHVNFKKRETCQKCGFGTQADVSAYLFNRTEVLAGDWYCQSMNCGAHNYAGRTSCYRCGVMKSDYVSGNAATMVGSGGYGSEIQPPGWKTSDWICTGVGCGMHNYASRTECYKCRTPRDFGQTSKQDSEVLETKESLPGLGDSTHMSPHMFGERKTSQPLIDLDTVIEEPTKVSIDPANLQLRFVFDRLEAPDLKSCFLCCALFPEYDPIDVSKLVNYFIDEGLLIGAKATAFERGLDIVWRLADASLLEVAEDNSTVKMHELTRGLALAILSSEAELCRLLLRSEVKLSQPRTTEKKTVQSLENSPRAFETVEGPGTSLILSSESREFITLAGAELKEPPVEEEWEEARMMILSGNKLSRLPARPMCNRLSVLLLQRNYSLRVIPSSFFDFMPSLQILDLSKTKIKSLPQSFTKLGSLQVLLLHDCVRLMVFPPEIGSLKRLEVLDLHGTEITQLPDTVSKLSSLRHLQLSFYGSDIRSDYVKLPTTLIPDGIIQNLNLTELGISMFGDHRWFSSALGVTKEVSCLELNALSFPFPDMNHLRHLIEESLSWKHGTLRKYNFVVGRDVKRIVSQVSSDVELMYSQQDRCLRFVNGEEEPRNPDAILEVVKQATAFYMDHCVGICFLSEFGISNLRELKLCIVRDCPNFETLVNDDEFQESILPDLETLSLNYLWNLKKIWIGRVPTGSLSQLRH